MSSFSSAVCLQQTICVDDILPLFLCGRFSHSLEDPRNNIHSLVVQSFDTETDVDARKQRDVSLVKIVLKNIWLCSEETALSRLFPRVPIVGSGKHAHLWCFRFKHTDTFRPVVSVRFQDDDSQHDVFIDNYNAPHPNWKVYGGNTYEALRSTGFDYITFSIMDYETSEYHDQSGMTTHFY